MVCNCKASCSSRRCACLKSGSRCQKGCKCTNCKNPLNNVENPGALTPCVLSNITHYQKLTEAQLGKEIELLCGCETTTLKLLINGYECSDCKQEYSYSFCWDCPVAENECWHCEKCNTCREWREWHCEYCNECTYGLSLPCESCGRKSDMAKLIS